jgi:hypothetical protein
LNDAGVVRPGGGKVWTANSVLDQLSRADRYAGYSEVNKTRNRRPSKRQYVRAKGNWQPIIDEDTYQRFLAERRERGWNRKLADTPYLLTGVCWCEVCKKKMYVVPYFQPTAEHPDRTYLRLVCTGKHPNRVVSYNRILSQMRRAIPYVDREPDSAVEERDEAPMLAEDIGIKELELTDISTQIQRAHRAYVLDAMNENEYTALVVELRARLAAAETELELLRQEWERAQTRGSLQTRKIEVARRGLYWMDRGGTEANQWLRSHLRVWVLNGQFKAITVQ